VISTQAYTLTQKARLAVTLALIGGFVDAVGLLYVGAFISNMTGNTALIGQQLAAASQRNPDAWLLVRQAVFAYLLCCMFLLGAGIAGLLIELGARLRWKSQYAAALALQAILLIAFVYVAWMLPPDISGFNKFLAGALPCIAMGLQNATVSRIAGSVVRTTHVTGVITDLGLEAVQFLFWLRDRAWWRRGNARARIRRARRISSISQHHPTVHRLVLLGSIWTSFLLGATCGAMLYLVAGMKVSAVLIPVSVLLALLVWDLLLPQAKLSRYDKRARDALLEQFGIDSKILPDQVGLYLVGGESRRRLRPPDLGRLCDIFHHAERIVILVLDPSIELSDNSAAGLRQSALEMRALRRELIVCTTDHRLFNQLSHGPLGEAITLANITSDIEFAAARAIELSDQVRPTRRKMR
jgi:uncharacterized membrane protein YoaK (UPF0700 family)